MKFDASGSFSASVEVGAGDALERVTGPQGDEWRAQFYPLYTTEDVIAHWLGNYVFNGVDEINRLDGWADLPEGVVSFDLALSYERVVPSE